MVKEMHIPYEAFLVWVFELILIVYASSPKRKSRKYFSWILVLAFNLARLKRVHHQISFGCKLLQLKVLRCVGVLEQNGNNDPK